mmetsp:Transcript_15668/g.42724  ORF Transcript_15668/g.42724 Transcript_15668/m.42724 type:complete len:88 (+) Transcript_15668:126-389(+)
MLKRTATAQTPTNASEFSASLLKTVEEQSQSLRFEADVRCRGRTHRFRNEPPRIEWICHTSFADRESQSKSGLRPVRSQSGSTVPKF